MATSAVEETAKPIGAGTGLEGEKPAEPVSESVRQKIARLILKLDTDDLRGLVQKIEQSRAVDGTEDEVASAVSELLQAAESGRLSEPSEALLKLVTKMGIHGGEKAEQEGAGSVGDSAGIGELVKQLGGDWNLDDPTPKDYKAALVNLSTQAAVLGSNPIWIEKPEPERMLQLAVELDDTGPQVEIAVNAMLEEGRIGDVISMLEEAPDGVEHISVFWGLVATPANIVSLLRKEPPDFETIDRLIPRLAETAAEPLIEVYGEVETGARASAIAERIVRLGPGIRRYAVDRLGDERWHVRRNMLALLSRFEDLPEDFTPAPYLVDPDPRVRRAAMRLGLAAWSEVETVMVAALEDSDPQIVELGIEAAKKHCPPLVIPYLEMIALDDKAASPIRVGAIQALASSGAPGALPMLLKLAWVRKFFLIRGLADKSSELMAVLAAINERWAEDHAAARVLRAARKSKDPQIRAVVREKGRKE